MAIIRGLLFDCTSLCGSLGGNGTAGSQHGEVGAASIGTDCKPSCCAGDTGTEKLSRLLVAAGASMVAESSND